MPRTATFMGPMARKKPVGEKYNPNSYRVVSYDDESKWFQPQQRQLSGVKPEKDLNILGQTTCPDTEHRHNRPNPRNVNFLRQDVRLLNEPVCDVHTSSTASEQHVWWNHHASPHNSATPQHTLDTTVREDFQYRTGVNGNTRHGANPNNKPAHGAVPVNMMKNPDGSQRLLKEGLSYEHQYNSRLDPSYPVRGKRHGAFVWDELPQKQAEEIVQHYQQMPEETTVQSEPRTAMTSFPTLPPIGAL